MPASTVYEFTTPKDQLDIVKATLPLVAQAGPGFTKHFYKILFASHPDLKNVFNQTNQAKGKQPQKLFTTVAVAAQAAIETGILPGEAIEGICQKHAALNITPEQYQVVGEHILQTIRDLLTKDEAILQAWHSLYNDIANIFTTREGEIAQEIADTPGAWMGRREFVLIGKTMVSENVVRLTFSPNDSNPVPALVPGKFTTIWVPINDEGIHGTFTEQPRHYTLATPHTTEEKSCLSISVKKDGSVSRLLHEASLQSTWELSAPHGCFVMSGVEKLWLTVPSAPIIFISAGIGLTPVLAMLENVVETRSVTWLHAAKNGKVHAYQDRLRKLASVRKGKIQRRVWYSEPRLEDGAPALPHQSRPEKDCSDFSLVSENDHGNSETHNTAKYHYKGRMDLSSNLDIIESGILHQHNATTQYFLCGPEGFMTAQHDSLVALGVDEGRIHSEGF